ncbi:GNAT family N-acetyltransferase [Neobacillus niacini]|uniref:GNAT family N-acetyltransferase n=1 Tax=Neobacillus niacini TaxID=86668 RepID=UPI0021CB076A|nr:GNAT family N-acetyltransferase [Neobacillus niacini]MCM3766744.1 GNAT family N-acetyltransferase [Neobacillus niacini]
MQQYEVTQVKDLQQMDLTHLQEESREEGFRFLDRLEADYHNGTNTFDGIGEALFAVVSKEGKVLAVGGINIDPFSDDQTIGRIRRFYVSTKHRRSGIGKLLLDTLKSHASCHFKLLVLNSSSQAEKFYQTCGFTKTEQFTRVTHILNL